MVTAETLRTLPQDEIDKLLSELTAEELSALEFDWQFWARPEQLPPIAWGSSGCYIWNIRAGRGWGKALSLDTQIPTVDGWKLFKDVHVGDWLFGKDGKPCLVTFETDVMQDHKCYRVVFSDGSEIVADAEHYWYTHTHAERKRYSRGGPLVGGIRTTEEIKNTLLYRNVERNHAVPLCGPVQYPKKELIIDPYVFGLWLGNGDSKSNGYTTADPETVEAIRKAGYIVKPFAADPLRFYIYTKEGVIDREKNGRVRSTGTFTAYLRKLGVYNNKHIPLEYLQSSVEDRMALLQGLMDTDGYIADKGACEYTTIVERFGQEVKELCDSLGIKATVSEGDATISGRFISKKYRVKFTTDIPVFRIERKLNRQKARVGLGQSSRNRMRYIVAVDPVESVPVKCIRVDNEDHLFLVGRSFIPTHNTRTAAETFRDKIQTGKYKHTSLCGATAEEVRDIMINGESGLMNCCPPWFRPRYVPSKKKIFWPNGAVTSIFYGSEPEKSRGAQSDLLWCDEIHKWQYPEDTFDNLILGLRLGDNPLCIVTSTPKPTRFTRELENRTDDKGNSCVVTTIGSTYANRSNLSSIFFSAIIKKYEGTRLGEQELNAQIMDDNPNALFKREWISRCRVIALPESRDIKRIVVAVDPAMSHRKGGKSESNHTGIIVIMEASAPLQKTMWIEGTEVRNADMNHYYVLRDESIIGTPLEWGTAVREAVRKSGAGVTVIEDNAGGDMVESTLLNAGVKNRIERVHAVQDKQTRASPVSTIMEQGRIHFFRDPKTYTEKDGDNLDVLEDELCQWIPGEDSPDRMDAFVHAVNYMEPSGDAELDRKKAYNMLKMIR